MIQRFVILFALMVVSSVCLVSWGEGNEDLVRATRILSPAESMKTMRVADGYRLELVASEPVIEEPVLCVWDGNGRMYVAEMRSYMQDIDGKGQFRAISRVLRLEDTDNDGVMDKHTVFADKLVLPRMVLPLDNGEVVIRETNTFDLYVYRDVNGDGVADEKKLWHKGGRRGGNLEHQPSGLVWAIDNWIYTTYSRHRYRFNGKEVVRGALPHGSGQWGLTQDDVGKLYYSSAGGENPAYDFQQPIVYGQISMPGEKAQGFNEVFPIDNIPDVQGGLRRVRKDNTLNHFTASAGQVIFRGHRMPKEMYGALFIPEPVGRLIRWANVENDKGKTVLSNAFDKKEFIASTDANFRPLNMSTGPDGTLYMVDMYRGIIQEGNWVRPGSYLRTVVQKYQLDRNIGMGRIYRIVHKDFKRDTTRPRMLDEKAVELVKHLSHPNGWWRDEAQKLLVIRRDPLTVSPLKELARNGESHYGRLHALWTLEGMDVLDVDLLREKMGDEHAYVRAAAVRISERLIQGGDMSLVSKITELAGDEDPNVSIQVMLTGQYTNLKTLDVIAKSAMAKHPESDAIRAVTASYRARLEAERLAAERQAELMRESKAFAESMKRGEVAFKTLCFSCHGMDGKGMPVGDTGMMMAPPLGGSPRVLGSKDRMLRIVLHGLTGPVDGKTFITQMVPMVSNDDQWVADVSTYIRNSFGNKASWVTIKEVQEVREATKDRKSQYTLKELHVFDPYLTNKREWKVSASHNNDGARRAIDGNMGSRWDTGTPQKDGMWYQVVLPREYLVQGVVLNATGSNRDAPKAYEVYVSKDGKDWEQVQKGKGGGPLTEIKFEPVRAKWIKIIQKGRKPGLYWSIHRMDIATGVE